MPYTFIELHIKEDHVHVAIYVAGVTYLHMSSKRRSIRIWLFS